MSAIRVIQFTDPHLFGDIAATLRGVNTVRNARAHARRTPRATSPSAMPSWSPAIWCRTTRAATNTSAACSRASANPCCASPAITISFRRCAQRSRAARSSSTAPPTSARGASCCSTASSPNQAGGHISRRNAHQARRRARPRAPAPCAWCACIIIRSRMHSRWLDNVGLANANEFWSVIDSHPQVKAVVWGHVHQTFEGIASQRAPDRHALHLRAVPAALRSIRHRQPAAGLSPADPALQRRHRYWRALPDCRRIRGMIFPEAMRRGLARGLAGLRCCSRSGREPRAGARRNLGLVDQGRAQHGLPRRLGARAAARNTRSFRRSSNAPTPPPTSIVMEVDLDDMDPLEAVQFITTNGTLPADQSLESVVGADQYAARRQARRIARSARSRDREARALGRGAWCSRSSRSRSPASTRSSASTCSSPSARAPTANPSKASRP